MAFHENAIFPVNISRGSQVGVGHRHAVFELDSGAISVVNRWPKPRRQFTLRFGARNKDDLRTALEFNLARGGMENGFRFRDEFEYSTSANGTSPPAGDDAVLGYGDGVTVIFQLVKTYTSAGTTHTRAIEKPMQGDSDVIIFKNGVFQTKDTHYTVDASTGKIQFATPPVGAPTPDVITGGCYFHVPTQFGADVDDLMTVSLDSFDAGRMVEVQLVEMVGNVSTPDQPWTGGSSAQLMSINRLYDFSMGHWVSFLPSVDNLFVTLPDITDLPDGGTLFVFFNDGSWPLDFRNRKGGALEWNLVQGEGAVVGVIATGVGKVWKALKGTQ